MAKCLWTRANLGFWEFVWPLHILLRHTNTRAPAQEHERYNQHGYHQHICHNVDDCSPERRLLGRCTDQRRIKTRDDKMGASTDKDGIEELLARDIEDSNVATC